MYSVQYKKSVEKDLRKLASGIREPIVHKIQALATNPRPDGATKIRGSDSIYRIRHADYRAVYRIHDSVLTVLIVKVGHRREVYRELR
jgi:mRNA interferase RelE/StbE